MDAKNLKLGNMSDRHLQKMFFFRLLLFLGGHGPVKMRNRFCIAFRGGNNRFCYVLFRRSNSSWFGFSVAEFNVGQGRFATTSQPNQRLGVQWLNFFLLAVSLRSRTSLEVLEDLVPISFFALHSYRYHGGGRPQSQNCVFSLCHGRE